MGDDGGGWLARLHEGLDEPETLLDGLASRSREELAAAVEALVVERDRKSRLLEVAQELGRHLELDVLFREVVRRCAELLRADRATLFLVDRARGEIWSRVAEGLGEKEIRLPLAAGIVGHVATTGELVNVADAYDHPLFNKDVDRRTGYRTKSLICAPIRDNRGDVLGVFQAINHVRGRFGDGEVRTVHELSSLLAQLLDNARLYLSIREREAEVSALLDVATSLARTLELDEVVARIMQQATELLDADRSTLFLLDRETDELWSKVAQGLTTREIRFPAGKGLAGHVVKTGETLNIADAYEHPLFNRDVDKATGYRTRTVLAMPIRDSEGRTNGVAQLINKNGGVFTEADERRLAAFSAQAGLAISNAQLFSRVRGMKEYLESILKSITNGVVTLDAKGRVAMVNAAARRLLDLDETDPTGLDGADFFGARNDVIHGASIEVAETGKEAYHYDVACETREGEPHSVNLNVVPLRGLEDEELGIVVVLEDITREKRIKTNLSRYMSKDLVERVLKEGELALGGVRQEVTILFSDIRSYTTLTENAEPADVVSMLNEYFSYMVDPIFDCGGVLDKYIGDAIMAVFGVPFADPERDAINGVRATLEMMRALEKLNVMRGQRKQIPIRMGIGLSTGYVLSGNIGSDRRMEYTVIGDGVNLASRLEGATKQYGSNIMISEFTHERIKDQFVSRELDTIRVKGKNVPVRVFEVLQDGRQRLAPARERLLEIHRKGLDLYRARRFADAGKVFATGLAAYASDIPFRLYVERCAYFQEQPPGDDWDGVWTLTEK